MPAEPTNDYQRLLASLTHEGVDFVVVGGTAAVVHGSSVATYDLDVLMRFNLSNCEGLLRAVRPLHPRLSHTPDKRPLELSAEDLVSFKNLYLATDIGRLDVLGSLPPIADTERVFQNAERFEVANLLVRVVSLPMLIEVKAAMGRPKDKLVEVELRAVQEARRKRTPGSSA